MNLIIIIIILFFVLIGVVVNLISNENFNGSVKNLFIFSLVYSHNWVEYFAFELFYNLVVFTSMLNSLLAIVLTSVFSCCYYFAFLVSSDPTSAVIYSKAFFITKNKRSRSRRQLHIKI